MKRASALSYLSHRMAGVLVPRREFAFPSWADLKSVAGPAINLKLPTRRDGKPEVEPEVGRPTVPPRENQPQDGHK
jgi:hypothetical protein